MKPVVAHAMRAYLARTETFVHNQMATLERYRPLPVAQFRRTDSDPGLMTAAVARELLPPPLAKADEVLYRLTRQASPPGVARMAGHVRANESRLLHFHYLTDARQLVGVQRRTGLPAVVSGYGYDVSSIPRAAGGLGTRWLRSGFDAFDAFLAMSDDMRDDMVAIGVPAGRVRVHYYGSDTARFRHPGRAYDEGRRLRVLCCGRLYAGKGQHHVLAALQHLGADVEVTFVGDGPLRGELERMAVERGWQERVRFAGHVPYTSDALVEHFREADVFAHPSVTHHGVKEGIPGTIVEAMASGLPVIATFHAGIPSVIEHDRHGLLVAEYDQDALTGALEAVLADAGLRRRLGTAAAERAASELDLRARTRVLERIYDDLA